MLSLILAALLQAAPAAPVVNPADPLPEDWVAIPDDEILVMTLAGNRTVVIRLAARLAPEHVGNVRKLALAHWWDGTSVYRVQENWVTQWGDATEKKELPAGVSNSPAAEYKIAAGFQPAWRLTKADSYSSASGYTMDGWPVASDGKAGWLTHCYGMVGVARDSKTTGSGSELFTPIGQSARRLDRNYTVVGRIVEGMQYMSAFARSGAPMGMYATPEESTGIVSVRLASDMPAATRPHFQYRATDNARFGAWLAAKEHPAAPMVPTGFAVCDSLPAVRRAP